MVSYGSNSTETITLTGPGTIYVAAAAPSASYSYTFVAINQANGQVAAISPTANFSAPTQGSLTAGNYLVKGVSYLTTDGGTIAVGSTESAIVNSGKCLLFSTNAVPVTIQGAPSNCTITNITAGTQTACNPANNTYTRQVTVTYSNAPAGNLVVNGQSFPVTSSPQTVTLTGLVSNGSPVNVTANFSAQPACTFTVNSLFTAPQSCQASSPCTTYNNNTAVPIGTGPANTITTTINVPTGGSISDVNITIVGTHTYVSDLVFTLQSPLGTIVTLIASQCTSEDNFNIKLDDQAANALACPISAGNTQRPQNRLSVFNGQNPAGNWILTIADQAADDGGQLTNWALEICRQTTGCSITNITAGTQTACNPATNTYTQQVTVTYTSAPATGNLVVNGQNFAITTSPQTVTLTGLVSNGGPVNVTASFSALTTCALTRTALFTAPQSCQASACTNYTNNTVVPISDGAPSAITSIINVPQGGTITDVNITLVGTHTYVGDLLVSLRSPAGTTVNLIINQCSSADNFNIKLDDQAANALTCPINAGSTQRPQNPLSAFNNQNSAGEWVLTINDQADQDGGQLTNWILEICRGTSNCNITAVTGGTQTACNPANNTYTQQVTVTFTGAPATGTLVVNGQNFTIGTSPRTVTLTGLPSNGNPIDVIASFSASPTCSFSSNNLFTAPTACQGTTCNTYNSTTVVPISNGAPSTITSTVNVPAGGVITDVNITMVGTHTYVGDLIFTLQSPSGTTVTLIAEQCTSADNFNIKLDDQAANALACPINAGSTQRPQNPLSIFNNESVGGNWILSISDVAQDDDGQLTSWILEICQEGGASNCNTPPPASGTIAAGTYQVSNTITTAGKIFSPSTVVFKAGTSITLTAGFEAKAGSTFTASIETCASLNEETVEARTTDGIVATVATENGLDIAPNPFSDQTTITYTLSETTTVTLTIYDLQGKRIVQPVVSQTRTAGSYQVLFDAQNIPKAMYMVILQTASGTLSRKIVLTE